MPNDAPPPDVSPTAIRIVHRTLSQSACPLSRDELVMAIADQTGASPAQVEAVIDEEQDPAEEGPAQ